MEVAINKGRFSFRGGVHPADRKELAQDQAILPGPIPSQLVVPLSQHIGQVCRPLVKKGQLVQQGELIADQDAYVSAPVHAPMAGKVKEVSLQPHPVLGRCMAVVIEVDQNSVGQADQPQLPADLDLAKYQPEKIRQDVRNAGLVGMGGAGFPTHVKLDPNPNRPHDTLIVNGCECEPYITCDYRLMVERPLKVVVGALLAAKAWGSRQIYIAIEDNKPKAIQSISNAIRAIVVEGRIEVAVLPTRYPQGGERQLIRAVTGRIVPTGGIPPMIGVLVLNVATASAIADAVVWSRPLTHRIVTVTGSAVARPANLEVPIGTPVGQLIDHCSLKHAAARVVLGGPMMGIAIADPNTPIIKTTNAIVVLGDHELRMGQQGPCIRCGRCVDACPEGLNPSLLARTVQQYAWDLAKDNFITACIECGCCSYVCPVGIELAGYIKTGKAFLARQTSKKT
jgi:electron transport complex protein RnfC